MPVDTGLGDRTCHHTNLAICGELKEIVKPLRKARQQLRRLKLNYEFALLDSRFISRSSVNLPAQGITQFFSAALVAFLRLSAARLAAHPTAERNCWPMPKSSSAVRI